MADLPELRPGDVIDGKYQIVSLLGMGGMGHVFKARHVHLNTFRTIKVMRRSLLVDEANRNRFVREARLATLVHHQNVAIVHDFSTMPDGTHYMVSEFIDGITVRQWMRQYGRFPVPLALQIALQTLSGLENIHRAGLLHRDLSADNIMISSTDEGEPVAKIIDLGVAKQLAGSATMSEATQVGLFIGNPRYSSPEQLGSLPDGEEIDGRADIYCFGIVLYEMLAGVPPFLSNTPHGYAVKHLTEPPPPFSAHPGGESIPAGLEVTVRRALEKQRRTRFSSAREFGLALAPYASDAIPEETRMLVASLRSGSDMVTMVTRHTAEVPSPVATVPDPEELEWRRIAAATTREPFEGFLSRFPGGAHAAEARTRLGDLDLVREAEQMAARADVSGLDRLAASHADDSTVGRAVRAALQQARERRAAEETQEWRETLRGATRESFQRFVRLYPDSGKAAEAQARLVEMDALDEVDAASRRSDAEALKQLAGQHTASPRVAEAVRAAMDRLADETRRRREAQQEDQWRAARREGSRDALQRFLEAWPDGTHALEAKARVEEIDLLESIERMRGAEDLAGLQALATAQAPNTPAGIAIRSAIGILEGDAMRRREQAEEEERRRTSAEEARKADEGRARRETVDEERDWAAAMQAGTEDGWATYLTRQPSSFRGSQAKRNREEAAHFEAALRSGGTPGLRAFLQSWPDSRFRPVVEQRLRTEDEEDATRAYAAAVRSDSEERWKRFIEEYPGSHLVAEATRRWTVVSELAHARKTDTINGWNELLARHADDPHMVEARARLHLLENLQKEHIDAAVSSRSAGSVRAILQADPWPGSSELARRAAEELGALQAAIRTGTVEGLRRFQRSFPSGHFNTTIEFLLGKHEDAAFSMLLQSHSRDLANRFIKDYPLSSRLTNVRRLLQGMEETDRFNSAMREIQRGKLQPAQEAAASLSDPQLRQTLRAEVERYTQSTGSRKIRMFSGWAMGRLQEQLRSGAQQEARYEPTPAMKDLRTAREATLEELKELAEVLKSEGERFAEPEPATPPQPESPERVLPAAKVTRTVTRADVAAPAPTPPRRRGAGVFVFLFFLFMVGFGAVLYRMIDREGADALVARGRQLARMVTLKADPEKNKATTGQLQIDALPWGRIASVKGGGREWVGNATWTPARIVVPPGRYEITVIGPDGKTVHSVTVDVNAGEPQVARVTFEAMDVKQYFSEVATER